MNLISFSGKVLRKIVPLKVYIFISKKIYIPLWETTWKMGLTEVAFSEICQSERAVEYAWVLKNITIDKGNLLDLGCKGTLFPVLLASMGFETWGIDLGDIGRYKSRHPNFKFIKGDVITASLPENYFDIITAISTIEHIGLDNDGDIGCMQRIGRLLKKDGIAIITIPYGKSANSELLSLRVYDCQRLAKLFEGWKIKKLDYFKELEPGKWLPSEESDITSSAIKQGPERVSSIVCILAEKNSQFYNLKSTSVVY